KVRAALVDVKEEIASMRREAEEDVRLRRDEVVKQEERLTRGEDQLDRRQQDLQKQEEGLRKLEGNLERIRGDLEKVAERHRREGRNIRAFEALTGVNLIIDDTPEALVLSCFDPVRRETARLALEKLVGDGRIHPARIEEMYERSKREVEDEIKRAGEEALHDVAITDVHPEMIKVLGRLRYRTSYGQNVLKHLVESAHIAAGLASELG